MSHEAEIEQHESIDILIGWWEHAHNLNKAAWWDDVHSMIHGAAMFVEDTLSMRELNFLAEISRQHAHDMRRKEHESNHAQA